MNKNIHEYLNNQNYQLIIFGVILLLLYLLTQPPNITFEDSSTIAAACATLGLNHPPGYPLHTLTCYPFATLAKILPFNVAQATAFASSLAAIAACIVLVKILLTLTTFKSAAFLTTFLLAIAPVFWSQAIIAEVYALNVLLIVLSILAVRQWIETKEPKWLMFLAIFTGLGISNHWPLYILTYPAFIFWLSFYWRELFKQLKNIRTFVYSIALFLLGLLPYLHLLVLSKDAYLFYQDYQTSDFFTYVGRSFYQGLNLDLDLTTLLLSTFKVSFKFIAQFNYVFGLFVILGLARMFLKRSKLFFGVIWGMLASTGILSIIKPHDQFYEYSSATFEVYTLPSLVFACIPLTIGIAWTIKKLKINDKQRVAITLAIMLVCTAFWYPRLNRSFEDIAYPHGELVVKNLDNKAKVILPVGDVSSVYRYAGLAYPDKDLTFIRNIEYFYNDRNNQILTPREVGQKIRRERNLVAYPRYLRLSNIGVEYHGTHFIFNKDLRSGSIVANLDEEVRQHTYQMMEMNERYLRNYHTRTFVKEYLISLADNLYKIKKTNPDSLTTKDLELIEDLHAIPEGKYGELYATVYDKQNNDKLDRVIELTAELEKDFDRFSEARKARIKYMLALAYLEVNDIDNAKSQLEESVTLQPSVFNSEAILNLLVVYYKLQDIDAYVEMRKKYPFIRREQALVAPDRWCEREMGEACI